MKRSAQARLKDLAIKTACWTLALILAQAACAEELLLFPNITGALRSASSEGYKKQQLEPAVDFFYSLSNGPVQVLAEFLLSREENELERIQLGLTSAQGYTVWLGRFHTPVSYWNTAYHHGAYLQPSISRPGIAEYEDHQGIMPMHVMGALMNGGIEIHGHRLNYEFAAGQGPILKETLEPFNLLSPHGGGKLSVASKLSIQADENSANEQGIFLGYTDIPIMQGSPNTIRQTVAGLFINREVAQWRLLSEVTFLRTRYEVSLDQPKAIFANAYAHVEYKLNSHWTSYGRLEGSSRSDDAYLNMFPGFIKSRALFGARWTPIHNQAVKLELSHNRRQDGQAFNALGAQWSMVFP